MMSNAYTNVLVPLDGSAVSDEALELAVSVAFHAGARLHLVHVHDTPDKPEAAAEAREYLATATKRAARTLDQNIASALLSDQIGGATFSHPTRGVIADILGRYAADNDIDLIVMSTHGRGGVNRAWMGSVADSLVRQSYIPILLYRSPGGQPPALEPRRILIALDGSERAKSAIAPAVTLGRHYRARYTLLTVIPLYSIPAGVHPLPFVEASIDLLAETRRQAEESLQRQAEPLRLGGLDVSTEMIEAIDPVHAINQVAEEGGYDLIALATRGQGGGIRLLLGSVADKLMRSADRLLLVINTGSDHFDSATTYSGAHGL